MRSFTLGALIAVTLAAASLPATAQDRGPLTGSAASATPATPADPGSPAARSPAASQPRTLGASFVLLYYYLGVVDGNLRAYGEIRNVSEAAAVAPEIVLSFLDESGAEIGREAIPPAWGWVDAGRSVPFQAPSVLDEMLVPRGWGEVVVEVGDDVPSDRALPTGDLAIAGIPGEGALLEGGTRLAGRVVNSGASAVGGVGVQAARYDEGGAFVGFCYDGFVGEAIAPGASGRFSFYVGDCGATSAAKAILGSGGPYTYKLILTRRA